MSDIVYICFSSTGIYEECWEEKLHGYYTEQEAKDFVDRSYELFEERWKKVKNIHKITNEEFPSGWHPECPTLSIPDFNGFTFWYEPVEMRR